MPLKKTLFTFSLLFINFLQAQKNDTVYVYEKVIVYDTVYVEKPLKRNLKDLILPILNINNLQEYQQFNLVCTTKGIIIEKRKVSNRIMFGLEAGIGIKQNSWTQNFEHRNQQFGENLGIWVSKRIFFPNLFLMLSANIYHWNSSFDLDANKEETYLDGFYFTKDAKPLLFQRFNNKHFEYALQLKLLYEWKKFRPFAGFLADKNTYKMQFLAAENNILNKLDDFHSGQINFGFSFGLQYKILSRISLSVDYQQCMMENLSLKNSAFDFDIFKTNNTFAERKFNLGIAYSISK